MEKKQLLDYNCTSLTPLTSNNLHSLLYLIAHCPSIQPKSTKKKRTFEIKVRIRQCHVHLSKTPKETRNEAKTKR